MSTFTALGLDPGGKTGWAAYQATHMYGLEGQDEWYDEKWTCGQLEEEDHSGHLEHILGQFHTEEYHIICEAFTDRPGKFGAKKSEAPKYIDVVKFFVRDRNQTLPDDRTIYLHMQEAGQAKPFVKDASIKKLGLWFPGKKHAMDAYRHLLFWLVNGPFDRADILMKGWKF